MKKMTAIKILTEHRRGKPYYDNVTTKESELPISEEDLTNLRDILLKLSKQMANRKIFAAIFYILGWRISRTNDKFLFVPKEYFEPNLARIPEPKK